MRKSKKKKRASCHLLRLPLVDTPGVGPNENEDILKTYLILLMSFLGTINFAIGL